MSLAALLAVACTSEQKAVPAGAKVDAELVADQPVNPRTTEFAVLATTQAAAEDQWKYFELKGRPPTDLNANDVLFVGFGESTGCELYPEGLELRGQTIVVTTPRGNDGVPDSGYACYDDFRSRTLVYRVPNGSLPDGRATVSIGSAEFLLERDPLPL